MRPDLQLALIGYGLAGRVFHAPLIQHTPGLVLHSIVSSQRDTLLRAFSDVHVRATPQ
ncbi:MAG: oxidoreductase, partial [Stenotrophomonas maltophilia]|nr:oxidoreductase [Stenotrophomonas maltophilia]